MANLNKIPIKTIYDQKVNQIGIIIPKNVDKNLILNDINKINFQYIKYKGIQKIGHLNEKNEQETEEYHFVAFESIPIDLVREIEKMIITKLESENYTTNFYECLSYVVSLFRKMIFPHQKDKELRGDICEALFILKAKKELGVDISKYYRGKDNLYDFYFDKVKRSVEIKGTTKNSGEIKISYRQINESTERDFFVVEYQFTNDGKNILQLYEEIGLDKSELIKSKYDKWKNYKDCEDDGKKVITEHHLVHDDKTIIYKYNSALLPKIDIKNLNSVKKVEVTLSTQNSKEKEFDEILNYI